jgi:hypothetical protein
LQSIVSGFAVERPPSIFLPRETEICDTDKKKTGPLGPVFGYVNSVERLLQTREDLQDDGLGKIIARACTAEIDSTTSGAAGSSVTNVDPAAICARV